MSVSSPEGERTSGKVRLATFTWVPSVRFSPLGGSAQVDSVCLIGESAGTKRKFAPLDFCLSDRGAADRGLSHRGVLRLALSRLG
jgi:hypothetical protein